MAKPTSVRVEINVTVYDGATQICQYTEDFTSATPHALDHLPVLGEVQTAMRSFRGDLRNLLELVGLPKRSPR